MCTALESNLTTTKATYKQNPTDLFVNKKKWNRWKEGVERREGGREEAEMRG